MLFLAAFVACLIMPLVPQVWALIPAMLLLAPEFRWARKIKLYFERKMPAIRKRLRAWGMR